MKPLRILIVESRKALDFIAVFAKIVAFATCLTQAANANLKHEITMPEATIALLEFGNDGKLVLTERQKKNFWSKVNKDGPTPSDCPQLGQCWMWNGCLGGDGYGSFRVGCSTQLAHRISFFVSAGRLPDGKPSVLHLCHTPKCVNPRHLHPGTQLENMAEMIAAGRRHVNVAIRTVLKGDGHPMAKLTEADVISMRARFAAGERNIDLVRAFGVSQPTVSRILFRKRWKHV